MAREPLIMVGTSNMPEFCRCHCCNADCSKHISKGMAYTGACRFSLMRGTDKCEGYISRRQQNKREIEQVKKEMREAGIE